MIKTPFYYRYLVDKSNFQSQIWITNHLVIANNLFLIKNEQIFGEKNAKWVEFWAFLDKM